MDFLNQLFDTTADSELNLDEEKILSAEFELSNRIFSLKNKLDESFSETTIMTLNKELKTLSMLKVLKDDYDKFHTIDNF